jgi:DNA helicase-2/ATP-dependent DNA helicase PcrA
MAIAEDVPGTEDELARISGVGPHKLRQFGAEVLALCAGEELPLPESLPAPLDAPEAEAGPPEKSSENPPENSLRAPEKSA